MGHHITPPSSCNWFAHNICCKLGNGKTIGFWKFIWMGNEPLSTVFPLIFNCAIDQDSKITDEGVWNNGVRVWMLI